MENELEILKIVDSKIRDLRQNEIKGLYKNMQQLSERLVLLETRIYTVALIISLAVPLILRWLLDG